MRLYFWNIMLTIWYVIILNIILNIWYVMDICKYLLLSPIFYLLSNPTIWAFFVHCLRGGLQPDQKQMCWRPPNLFSILKDYTLKGVESSWFQSLSGFEKWILSLKLFPPGVESSSLDKGRKGNRREVMRRQKWVDPHHKGPTGLPRSLCY